MLSTGKPTGGTTPRNPSFVFRTLCFFTLTLFLSSPGNAQNRDLVANSVNPAERRVLARHHPAWASAQNDSGAVPADLPLEQLALVLSRPPQLQQAFDQFLSELQDPASPNYHQWLTPVEVGERFGASQHDIDAIRGWLQSQNLRVDSVANNRMLIRFSGPAAAIGNAFGTEMHYFLVDGEQRISATAEPQVPAALAGIINSVTGLSTPDIRPNSSAELVQVPMRSISGDLEGGVTPDFTSSGGSHYIFPADFAAIYNVNVGNITGAGQTIAIIGIARVYDQDIINFETLSGLAAKTPTVMIPTGGADPGPPLTTVGTAPLGQGEATLDVTRTTSIAPGATIDLVVSSNTASGSGLDLGVEYVVDTSPVFAHIMSISFGGCENTNGQAGVNFFNTLFSAAAAEGISVFVASGDSGAAGCDVHFATPPASQMLSPNFICSSSHATCVGGTEFADFSNPALYWASTNNAVTRGSALGYIPEGAWNDPLNGSNQPQVAGTGGGVSAFIPTPVWQTGTGVPGTQGRYTPDVAFSASGHDAYFGCMAALGVCGPLNGSFFLVSFGGTSAAAPDMAGITALLNQKTGSAQGELNASLYRLAATPGNNVFHDVTAASSGVGSCAVTTPSMCNNSTPSPAGLAGGLSGYLVGAGYDEATGLGSINVANLLANWTGSATTTTVTPNVNPSASGSSVTFAATVSTFGPTAPTGTVNFFDGATHLGVGTLNGSGSATLATSSLTSPGQHTITAAYSGDASNGASTSASMTVTITAATFTLTSNAPTSQTISSGQSANFALTVTPSGSYTSQITFACTLAPVSSGTCAFAPSTITPNLSTSSTTLTITGAHAAVPNFIGKDRGVRRLFPSYGFWLLMEAGGLFLLLGKKKSRLQQMTGYSLAGFMLVTLLAIAGCGSTSSTSQSTSNPGTTYQVTITASAPASASGTSASVNQTQTVSLTVH